MTTAVNMSANNHAFEYTIANVQSAVLGTGIGMLL